MKGIAVAGSILVDIINTIDKYPSIGELTKIKKQERSTGGLVPNVGIDLKRLDNTIDVIAFGVIGKDELGNFAVNKLKEEGLDVSNIKREETLSSFTSVMSVDKGQRTFFTYQGSSSLFGYDSIDFDKLDVKLFHLGYFLLLDKIDNGDGIKILKKCKELGIKTSIDLVSENSDRYSLVVPCLKYVDNLIINELEASKLSGVEYNGDNILEIAKKLKDFGVKERVIIHMPKESICLSDKGYTIFKSFKAKPDYIKGTTGAGDAFCAGSLIGIYKDLSDEEILKIGTISAFSSLESLDATSAIKDIEILKREYVNNIC